MKKRNIQPEVFCEGLYRLQKENRQQAAFLADVEQIAAQLRMDVICGSWIATGGRYSLLVRRCTVGYTIMLCDTTRCYKTIIREMLATIRGERLYIEADMHNEAFEITLSGDGLLHCGPYGVFCMEESLLHGQLNDEIEFVLRSNAAEDENFQ